MAKYDWKQLEKEYILSDYKSVKEFLKKKILNLLETPTNRQKAGQRKRQ